MGMGEFNSDDHYIYCCGQESLRRNGVTPRVNKRIQNAVLECNLKNDRMILVHFQDKPTKITVNQVHAATSDAEEAKVEQFYEYLQDLLELTPIKMSFHHKGLECNNKSRDTQNNVQIWPWCMGQRPRILSREHIGHTKHSPPTKQETTLHMASPDGQY